MPMLILDSLEIFGNLKKGYIGISLPDEISRAYPIIGTSLNYAKNIVVAQVYINRFFNREGRIVKEYKKMQDVLIKKFNYNFILDLEKFNIFDGIPLDSFVDLLITNIIFFKNNTKYMFPVFPNEFRKYFDPSASAKIKSFIDTEIEKLEKIGSTLEVIGMLYQIGLPDIANDLSEGLKRYHITDYEGSIKFFRKVVEGWKNILKNKKYKINIPSETRVEKLQKYTQKSFDLLSNFGEHSGTYGFMHEAILSKDIAVSLSRYMINYFHKTISIKSKE